MFVLGFLFCFVLIFLIFWGGGGCFLVCFLFGGCSCYLSIRLRISVIYHFDGSVLQVAHASSECLQVNVVLRRNQQNNYITVVCGSCTNSIDRQATD